MWQLLLPALAFLSTALWGCGSSAGASTETTTTVASAATAPTTTTPTTTTAAENITDSGGCLCLFDIDRTLTGKQGQSASCPGDEPQPDVWDSAYGGGELSLSALAKALGQSACAPCYVGTISKGDASGSGSKEREAARGEVLQPCGHRHGHHARGPPRTHRVLQQKLGVEPGKLPAKDWSGPHPVTSPLVVTCSDGKKQDAVPGILAWYRARGIQIADSDVHFFDDRSDNVLPFRGLPYNARQVSCTTRDYGGKVGLCGATLSEIVLEKGVKTCHSLVEPFETVV
mmetsp:Transcript_5669/g.17487  ORF Transcript_5669/g.17487 Transcript_5669/m.17487 type:complete len:286 (+) Transcript_5669:126-983(+)